eukprot:2106964-Alexandrium_andersonii.AAC.1
MTTSALLPRALLVSCALPTRRAAARRAPNVRPATMWPRGWSGVTTTSPPRAAVVVVAVRLAIDERGVRAERRASPALGLLT